MAEQTTREYFALLELHDADALAEFVGDVIVGSSPEICLNLVGIEAADFGGFRPVNPFTRRAAPKIDTEFSGDSLTWFGKPQPNGLHLNLDPKRITNPPEEVVLKDGIVVVPPIKIRGKNHARFNKHFRKGSRIEPEMLKLRSDRSEGMYELPKRYSESIFPMVGKLNLFSIELD